MHMCVYMYSINTYIYIYTCPAAYVRYINLPTHKQTNNKSINYNHKTTSTYVNVKI